MVPRALPEKVVLLVFVDLQVSKDTWVQGEKLELQAKWDLLVNLEYREWLENAEGEAHKVKTGVRAHKVFLEYKANKVIGVDLAEQVRRAWLELLDYPE